MTVRRSLLLLPILVLLTTCGGPHPRPNVMIILVDTLRADHLGCLGDKRGLTPAMDRLAASGTLFTQAIAPAPFTAPAVSSIMTGVSPLVHGVRSWADFGKSYTGPSLAEVFRDAGYDTAFIGANGFLGPIRPIRRGFEWFKEVEDQPAPALTKRALAWIRKAKQPWFLWVHYFDCHAPYVDHPENGNRFLSPADRKVFRAGHFATASPARSDWPQVTRIFTGLYAGEVAYADHSIGHLLNSLKKSGLMDHTEVVLTADHGENLADHPPYFCHNDALFDSLLHVPLIYAGVGIEKHRRIDTLADTRDIGRTLFALAGFKSPEKFGGRSFAPDLNGKHVPPPDFVVSDAGLQKVRLLSIRTDKEKVLRQGVKGHLRWFRFDLTTDPGENRPLGVSPRDFLVSRLKAWLLIEKERHDSANRPLTGPPEKRTPEEIKQLETFGYLR